MNSTPPLSGRPVVPQRAGATVDHAWILLAVLAAGAVLAVTNDSFWTDEFVTAGLSSMPSLGATWDLLQQVRIHDIQLPFYVAYMWGWMHLLGSGEWLMRAAAIPWFVGGAAMFAWSLGRMVGNRLLVALLCAFTPLAWFYLNEARVYAFELGFALCLVGAAVDAARSSRTPAGPSPVVLFLLGLSFVGLSGSSVLGAVWACATLGAVLVVVPPARWVTLFKRAPVPAVASGICLLALLAYYDWTRGLGLSATAVGTTTPSTIVFVIYELLGFSGLGPGRLELREAGAAPLIPYLPVLAMAGTVTATVLWLGIRDVWSRLGTRRFLLLLAVLTGPALLLFAIGVLTRFRVLGRHVIPLLPFVLVFLAFGVARAWQRGKAWRFVAIGFFLVYIASSLSARFAFRHKKDDYRTAAGIARQELAAGRVVWWNAEPAAPFYYHFPAARRGSDGVVPLQNPMMETVTNAPVPDVIIRSRPDTYDARNTVAEFMQEHRYRAVTNFQAFTVWTR